MALNYSDVKVWDPLVRIFHWSLVGCFTLAYLSGDELETLHIWLGYTIAGLLVFRVVWGLIGTRYARFSSFVFSPAEIMAYLKSLLRAKPRHYLGHNPAGGAMVVVLLLTLCCLVGSGLALQATEGEGLLAATFWASLNKHNVEEFHELAANLTLALVFVHVVGVLVSSLLHRENLVKAMWTGYKKEPCEADTTHE